MSQVDLEDLPPKVAQAIKSLSGGDVLVVVQGGLLVARLAVLEDVPAETSIDRVEDLPPDEHAAEIMSQFNAMIHDEF